jgi:hypothetical protein
MKILSYYIPMALQKNEFLKSLHEQFHNKGGKLSPRQLCALKDVLDIEEDFYSWDYKCINDRYRNDYELLKSKLIADRFKTVKGRNKCIRAMQSIIDGKPDFYLIEDALTRLDWRGYRGRR